MPALNLVLGHGVIVCAPDVVNALVFQAGLEFSRAVAGHYHPAIEVDAGHGPNPYQLWKGSDPEPPFAHILFGFRAFDDEYLVVIL